MTAETSQPLTPVPLRRNSGFRLLWIGQVLSDTGTGAAFIAYPLLVLALTHSAVTAGVVGTVRLMVELMLGLPGGALADRLDRRLMMIVCDATRAIVLAGLAVLVLVHLGAGGIAAKRRWRGDAGPGAAIARTCVAAGGAEGAARR
jgi:MFS family permease